MKLYHYTCIEHLESILASGVLRTTESNISAQPHTGPDVVWLTSDDRCRYNHGLKLPQFANKSRIRFTVDVPYPGPRRWLQWAPTQPGAQKQWISTMIRVGGGAKAADTWWITEDPIPAAQWVECLDRERGVVLAGLETIAAQAS